MTDHILFTFSTRKSFASGKIKICEMWVERLADEWIATSSPMFATEWLGFHKFSRGPTLISNAISSTILSIVNLSITTGTFPSTLESSIISPLLKKPSLKKEDLSNYHPIANLSFISKLTKMIV